MPRIQCLVFLTYIAVVFVEEVRAEQATFPAVGLEAGSDTARRGIVPLSVGATSALETVLQLRGHHQWRQAPGRHAKTLVCNAAGQAG